MNQALEAHLENLHHQLRFLPEQERKKELAELRSHLEERIAAYESAGDSPEQALVLAWQKFGDPKCYVGQLQRHYYLVAPLVAMGQGVRESAKLFFVLGPVAYLGGLVLARSFQASLFYNAIFGATGVIMLQMRYRMAFRSAREELFGVFGAALLLSGVGLLAALVLLPKSQQEFVLSWHWIYFAFMIGIVYFRPFKERKHAKTEVS